MCSYAGYTTIDPSGKRKKIGKILAAIRGVFRDKAIRLKRSGLRQCYLHLFFDFVSFCGFNGTY